MFDFRNVLLVLAVVAGCAPVPPAAPAPPADQTPKPKPVMVTEQSAQNFLEVVRRVEPVAEALCRAAPHIGNCDFRIAVDSDPTLPANAFQTVSPSGRPIIVFTLALIAEAHNEDELAFVLGHEAGHHILGHIARQEAITVTGAMIAGVQAAAAGADRTAVAAAQQKGAEDSYLTFSKTNELEADRLGTEIAYLAGYNPLLGAAFFDRIPDPDAKFRASHPPNAQRKAEVQATMAAILADR